MTVRLILIVLFSALLTQSAVALSEDEKARPNKEEISSLVLQVSRMTAREQDSRIARILKDAGGSITPRSDFLFCTGLAYLGNYKAQMCVGHSYEKGLGVVEDLSEAYTWYAVASENVIADGADAKKVQDEKELLKARLMSAYPHPTEDELVDMVEAQKTRISQYRESAKKPQK